MSSTNASGEKKKKRKRTSPFRIKVGCLVALRYRPIKNRIQLEGSDGKLIICDEFDREENGATDGLILDYEDPVSSAQFSEVWTDPLPGHDDGLALIGSRIRCFFPKYVLSESYNATSQLLGGEVVNVVNYCEEQYNTRRDGLRNARDSGGILVDLLVDNKENRLQKAFPFLKRVDPVMTKEKLATLSESEKRNFDYEERIKGGPDKAIVRVLLDDEVCTGIPQMRSYRLQAKWVIRKRVPAKIVRQALKSANAGETLRSKANDVAKDINPKDSNGASNDIALAQSSTVNGGGMVNKGNGKWPIDREAGEVSISIDDLIKEPPKKKRKGMTTNKDFSSSRFVGDGNDGGDQQESNWRWQAARCNPHSVLADHPLSMGLLKRMCYNFVGEAVRIEPNVSTKGESLASVTIRCLALPEHTLGGRLSHHGRYDIFDMQDFVLNSLDSKAGDSTFSSNVNENSNTGPRSSEEEARAGCFFLRVPIEDLVIVRRKVLRDTLQATSLKGEEMTIRQSYSFQKDTYFPLKVDTSDGDTNGKDCLRLCHRCRQESSDTVMLPGKNRIVCRCCKKTLNGPIAASGREAGDVEQGYCDCNGCIEVRGTHALRDLSKEVQGSIAKLGGTLQELGKFTSKADSGFIASRFVAKGLPTVDFTYSQHSPGLSLTMSSSRYISKIAAREPKKGRKLKLSNLYANRKDGKKSLLRQTEEGNKAITRTFSQAKKESFRPTLARALTYDANNRRFDAPATALYEWKLAQISSARQEYPELPRNHRDNVNSYDDDTPDNSGGKKLNSRAARANQRRLVRGIGGMRVNVDTLAGREQQLRFDRSGIHDWGVFVDIDVREGEMIVEYRGVVIGNAMAEKREKEYHDAKLGSDYMFRIDESSVCDATKEGNVARFINASCDPNCYTKIISLDGMKRIVIYAKRDIKAGEELCYDYMFAFESEPSKRIPCHCGARECRGFLNWDKRLTESEVAGAVTSAKEISMRNTSSSSHPI